MVVKVNVEKMEKAVGIVRDSEGVEVEQENQGWSLKEEAKLVKSVSKEAVDSGLVESLSMCVFAMVLFAIAIVVFAATWPLWVAYAVWSIVKKV